MAERYIPEHRRTNFKAKSTFKPDELRRRREEQQVEIRRQKREENITKRRMFIPATDAESDDEEASSQWGDSVVRRPLRLSRVPGH